MREYGFSLTHTFPYKDRICDSFLILENTGQSKPVLSHILCSASQKDPRHLSRVGYLLFPGPNFKKLAFFITFLWSISSFTRRVWTTLIYFFDLRIRRRYFLKTKIIFAQILFIHQRCDILLVIFKI